MAREIKTGLRIDMKGNISSQSKRYTESINQFSQSGQRGMKKLGESAWKTRRELGLVGASADKLSHDLDRVSKKNAQKNKNNNDSRGNRLTGLATGVGAVAMVRQVGEMERRMTRLGIAADQSDASIKQLKDDIYAAATAPDIRVDPSQIIGAIEQVLEMTGDFEFSKDQIRNIGIALQATGADAESVGALFAEFEKAGIKSPAAVAQAIGTLAKQGKEGAFTLKEFAGMGPRLFSAYAAVGRSGQLAAKEIGAVSQVVRGSTGNSEQATTSIENLLRVFSDTKKIAGLNKAGIKVFDAAELKKGHQVLRPINELMVEIIKKTKGKATLIQDLMGDTESARAFGNLIKEYNQTGDVKSLEHFMQLTDDGTMALKDSQRAANDSAAAMTELVAVSQKFADDKLTAPIHNIAESIKFLTENTAGLSAAIDKVFGSIYAVSQAYSGVIDAGAKIYDTVAGGLTSESMKRPEEAPKIKKPSGAIPGTGGYVPYVPPEAAANNAQAPATGPVPAQYNDLGRDKPAQAQAAAKPADGKITVEIISQTPVAVKSVQANSGEINVKNKRAGAHFQ
jgi:hypothetical protein